SLFLLSCFFLPDPPPTLLYPLSLHDALPIFNNLSQLATFNRFFRCQEAGVKATILIRRDGQPFAFRQRKQLLRLGKRRGERFFRSEEHTSELQSRFDLVCRLLLEKKKTDRLH